MKLVLIISVITSISAIKVPSAWQPQPQPQPNQNTNINNNVNRDTRPIRPPESLAPAGPIYSNINPFINNVPNTAPNGVIANGNLFSNSPLNYNWFGPGTQNGIGFLSPANQINSENFLNGNLNSRGNANEIRRRPYGQQRLVQHLRNFNRRPVASANTVGSINEAPGKVPYITYTTQSSAPQAAAHSTLQPVHNTDQTVNFKQAYPQVTSPKTVVPLKELDFSPLDPFPHSQLDVQASTQISNQNTVYSTVQPVNNLDFSLNNPFPHNRQVNSYQVVTQFPQASRIPINGPLFTVADNRRPGGNSALRHLDFNPFKKNYRDHRTHEPSNYDTHYDKEPVPAVERLQSEKAPVVKNHEYPAEVPTRPIYPGEGQWAKAGFKHKPFISKQQYANLEEPNEQPDGYDTFLEGQKLFENQKAQFGQRLQQFPNNNYAPTQQASEEENTEKAETFVPTRLYAQVRHSEDEKHLPPESDENGRLKELVKDTKIQTIYSEEGFEDSAYDHAGHEKKAESIENVESDEKNEEAKQKKKIPLKKYDRQSSSYSIGDQNLKEEDIEKLKNEELNLENETEGKEDNEPAGTHYEEQSYLNRIEPTKNKDGRKKAFLKSKEIKTVTATDKGGGNIEMEISSEVKAILQPNNSTKVHKYVKIYPKVTKNVTDKENQTETVHGKTVNLDAERRSLTVNPNDIFIEEIINQTGSSSSIETVPTTIAPTEYTEIVTIEMPKTTEATTSIPRLQIKNEKSLKPKNRRRKRAAVGIPEIEIDTDFIDQINHDIGKPTEKSNAPNEKKYPYYNKYKEKGLHENSPLRYSEDLDNVPVKTEGKLAFYDVADKKMTCSDVNPEVNPVPDRINNADESVEDEEEDEEGNDPAAKAPRLGKLGDKIDCFKAKYFGENPLDNPFFQEESVGPVKPIFSEIEKISTKKIGTGNVDNVGKGSNLKNTKSELNTQTDSKNSKKATEILHAAASSLDTENEIDDGNAYKHGLTSWFPGKNFGMGENTERDSKFVNHFVDRNPNLKVNIEQESKQSSVKESAKEVRTLPPATLITTPKYTIDLKPKHIYDQIELLEYLPDDELDEVRKAIDADLPKLNLTEITTPLPNINKTETVLNAPMTKKKKKSGKKNSQRKAKMLKNSEESMRMETSDNSKPESLPEVDALQLVRKKPKKPLYEIFDINKYLPKVPKIPFPAQGVKIFSTTNPNYLAPVSIINPTYEVFDINKYLPTTPFPLFKDFITQGTVLPKYKVISEVFYKEDIKPNEQLNVFTDVLKHIKNFPKLKDSFPESSQTVSVKLNAEKMTDKYPQSLFEEAETNNKDYFSSTITTIMTTFDPKMYASNHKYPHTESPIGAEKQIEKMLKDFKTNNRPKRRRRIKTTTQETPMVIEQSTSTLQYISEPTEVMGLMPPIIQGYKTIYHPKRDNSQHISNPTIRIEERKINKYFVQGMRPPPKQKVYLYSDFLTDNHIVHRMSKPKRNKLRRSRRSAQRPAYAQVARNRNKQPDKEPEAKKEEEDDYVPHRSKNYHYDEKTGKIVYDKKPQEQTEEEEEVEYIEVVEETPKTTAKPKQSPIFATATPPPEGQSYTDFVKLLKSASNYHEIPDPTTTEKGAEEVTQKMVASTLQPVSTTPPEFLSILAKVRNDTTYKLIEDKKKTTTSKPTEPQEEEAESTEEEESQVDDIRNSPGGQGYDAGANLEIFDIGDFLPNVKSYLPKTSVDTSKYKTIERPHLRHSISSRYNSDDDKDLQNVNTNKQPLLPNTEAVEKVLTRGAHKEQVEASPTSAAEATTQKSARVPSRRRTTTARSVPPQDNTVSTTQATAPSQDQTAHHDKARRNYRRRPTRIKVNPTTENILEAGTDNTTKIVRRRSERHSQMYADGNEKYEQFVESDGNIPNPSIPTEDYVDYEDVSDNPNNTTQQDNIGVVAKKVVEVFKNYNKDQKHGGNYKKEDELNKQVGVVAPEGEVNRSVEVIKPYDKTKKHGGNYKAEKEDIKSNEPVKVVVTKLAPKDVKKIDVFKNYDKTKKHGGNYKPANEDISVNEQDETSIEKTETIQIQNVNIFQDYDKTKKHGGNYKPENEEQNANIQSESPLLLKNVEVFKDYDEAKKHGGNYKPEKVQEQQLEESQLGAPQFGPNILNDKAALKEGSVEVFKKYDKTKKHGGNYLRENDTVEKGQPSEKQEIPSDKAQQVEVFKNYNQEEKTGGNYRREELIEPKADETHYAKSKAPQTKRYVESRNDVQRLADVVLKPETFYSDVTLPLDINALKIVKDLSHDELEEIVNSAEVDADDKNQEENLKNDKTVVTIGNKIKIPPVTEKPITTTKKPLFIKDPSKRLYFYAPVR